ncbi:protein-disulfide reductase [Ranunculus cassubicifolius]
MLVTKNAGDLKVISYHSKFSSLLGSKQLNYLLSPTGNQVEVLDLENCVVGIYFSANWYLPCRDFTTILVDIYEEIKRQGDRFEIIFVSSDEDFEAFTRYRATMPWLAVPFSDLDTKKALNQRFNIEGIPSLIILQPNDIGENETCHDGVDLIYRYGVHAFPFTKRRLQELEKEESEKHKNQTITNLLRSVDRDYLLSHTAVNQVTVGSLEGRTIGLYFSANWCVPCHNFTPKLKLIYHKIKEMLVHETDKDFEVVFVSSDREQEAYDSYFETMPWLALPFEDPTVKTLTKYFDVQGIPSLVIIGPDGKTLSKQGRSLVNLYSEKAYPFTESKLKVLEMQMDEEAKKLPSFEFHQEHRHGLTLVSEGNGGGPFICCDCEEQGSSWAYQCIECGYEVHPRCVKPVDSTA